MKKVKLGEIASLITKGTTPTSIGENFEKNGINFVKIESISEEGKFIKEKFAFISNECNQKLKRSQLKENDILFSIAGAIGRVAIVAKEILPANTNQALAIIRIDDKYDKEFLLYLLKSSFIIKQYNRKKQGVAQINLSLKDISELEIPIIDKERQIIIKENLKKVSNIINVRKQQIRNLEEFIKSQFVEMFGNPILNNKGWKTDELNNVAPSKPYKGELDNRVWLSNLDMVESQSGRIIDYIYEDVKNVGNSTCKFSEDNILYSKLRPYLNKVVIPDKKGIATSELIPLLPEKNILGRYFLAYLLRSDEFVNYISEKVAGAKMPRVSMDIFRSFKIILPPIELQNQFAEFVKLIDKQKFEIEKSLKETEELYESMMEAYFG